MKQESSAYKSEKKKIFNVETDVDGMSGNYGWFIVVNDPREEVGVLLGGGDTHVFRNIRDQIVPVLRRSPQAI